MGRLDSITFEKKTEEITVTLENIKDHKMFSSFLENRCKIVTKKSENRPWLYIKDYETLKTLGGARLNKNSIATFYIDTKHPYLLSKKMFGIISKEKKNYITNKIIINDLKSLEIVCELINDLMENGKLYTGKRS